MVDFLNQRQRMVEEQIINRGITYPTIVSAFLKVAREKFIPEKVRDFAYHDRALPIEDGQTISQPYIVALMIESLGPHNSAGRILEVGAGSGYAAAILGHIAQHVYSVERNAGLFNLAQQRVSLCGLKNVEIILGDGTLGLAEQGPFDGIVVSAGGPEIPQNLLDQLKVGGRLVIPVGTSRQSQTLLRITRVSEKEFDQEDLGGVMFVPLIGQRGWSVITGALAPNGDKTEAVLSSTVQAGINSRDTAVIRDIRAQAEPFTDLQTAYIDHFIERVGDARVVLLGESSHGTSEFYRMRARLTLELISKKKFNFVAVEADWPDAARIDRHARSQAKSNEAQGAQRWKTFSRFPAWMWRNEEFEKFVNDLRNYNQMKAAPSQIAFYGLDLYSLYVSMEEVTAYLARIDPLAARLVRQRYACLSPWARDPSRYGHDVIRGNVPNCGDQVVANYKMMTQRALRSGHFDRDFFDALQNARLARNAERYYRKMYQGSSESWNIRSAHMFETLKTLLDFHGESSRAIVWEHNSHVGNARATEMGARGEHNLGQLCREEWGDHVYAVGFGTHHGTVAAASDWEGPMKIQDVTASHPQSYENLFHQTGVPSFFLPLKKVDLKGARLERAIGVVYRPQTELLSHYSKTNLADEFDEYVWFDKTHAVRPLDTVSIRASPDTYPFGI